METIYKRWVLGFFQTPTSQRELFMQKLIAVIFIAIFGFAGVAMAQDEHVAFFKSVSGNVKIVRGKTDIVPVAGTQLMKSDIIVSGWRSSAGVVFKDGTLQIG